MLLLSLATASVLASLPQDAPPARAPLPVLTFEQLHARLAALSGAELLPVGLSLGGREIQAVRLREGHSQGKPAILVVANVDGSQPWTSSLALHHAEALAARASEGPLAQLLAAADVIVVPCANPDAHERRFATPLGEDEATGRGVDNDRDGREGEDPPSDIDGDGRITWLRVEDPEGEWIADPADPRAMLKADAKKGERGRWKLWPEGRDLDRDERVAEDAPADARLNRNFSEEFKEHAPESGRFPMELPEARALAEFLLLHPEIALVLTYGQFDNLVEKPKAVGADARTKLVPAAGWIESDAELLAELGRRYGELTGNKAKGRGGDYGTFQAWCYGHRGLWSLAIQPWDIPLDAKPGKPEGEKAADGGEAKAEPPDDKKEKKDKREPSDDAKRLVWLDQHASEAGRFVPWKEFQHPELGRVEIGGFAPFARSEPPAESSAEIAEKELAFLASLGAELAHARIAEFTAKPLGADVYELEAAIENGSRLPLMSASARRTDTVRALRIRLELGTDEQLLGGDSQLRIVRQLAGAGGREELRWLVRTPRPSELRLRIDTDHAWSDERRAEVTQ